MSSPPVDEIHKLYVCIVISFHYFSIFRGICDVTAINALTDIQEIIKYYLNTK